MAVETCALSHPAGRIRHSRTTTPADRRCAVTMTPAIVVTDDTTADELAECLTHMCAFAKRQQRIVERLSTDEPSEWTKAHRRMDGPLDDWLKAKA